MLNLRAKKQERRSHPEWDAMLKRLGLEANEHGAITLKAMLVALELRVTKLEEAA